MAPTEGRFARPERRWDCRHGTPCCSLLLGIKWNHVWNDEVRWTTGQPQFSAIVQAWRFLLFGHTARLPDETDTKILTASPWRTGEDQPGSPRTTWMKVIQQDLKSNNVSQNEAIDMAQNRPLWRLMSTIGTTHS